MAKSRSHYICRECGAEYSQYFGQCRNCGTWNSLDEVAVIPARGRKSQLGAVAQPRQALPLSQVSDQDWQRLSTGSGEFDRVLGGGIVPGSLVLVAGDAGIGKSTLLLQTLAALAGQMPVLYVCAEESAQQVK